jgi:hypothetical protein
MCIAATRVFSILETIQNNFLFASDYWQHHVTEKREWFLQDEQYKATT